METELTELIAENEKAAADVAALRKFDVSHARFNYSEDRFSRSPTIEPKGAAAAWECRRD